MNPSAVAAAVARHQVRKKSLFFLLGGGGGGKLFSPDPGTVFSNNSLFLVQCYSEGYKISWANSF